MIYSSDNSFTPYADREVLQQWGSGGQRTSPEHSSTSSTAVGTPLEAFTKAFGQYNQKIAECALDSSERVADINGDEDEDADAEGEEDDGEYVTMAMLGYDADDADAEGEEDDSEYLAVATFRRDEDRTTQGDTHVLSKTRPKLDADPTVLSRAEQSCVEDGTPLQNLYAPAASTSSFADVAIKNGNGPNAHCGAFSQCGAHDNEHKVSPRAFSRASADASMLSIFTPWTKEDLQPILDDDALSAWRADSGDLSAELASGDPTESMSMDARMAEQEDLQGNAHLDVRPISDEVSEAAGKGDYSKTPSGDYDMSLTALIHDPLPQQVSSDYHTPRSEIVIPMKRKASIAEEEHANSKHPRTEELASLRTRTTISSTHVPAYDAQGNASASGSDDMDTQGNASSQTTANIFSQAESAAVSASSAALSAQGSSVNSSAAASDDHSNITIELEDYAPALATSAPATITSTIATYDLFEEPAFPSTSAPAPAPAKHRVITECEYLDENGQKCGHPFGVNIHKNQTMREVVKEHIREVHLKPAVAAKLGRPLDKINHTEANPTRIECRLLLPMVVDTPSTRRLTGACGKELKYKSMLGHIDRHYGYQSGPRM